MNDEILEVILGEATTEEFSDVEVKQNTGPLGGAGGVIAGILAVLGLAFFTDFFQIIIDFIADLF